MATQVHDNQTGQDISQAWCTSLTVHVSSSQHLIRRSYYLKHSINWTKPDEQTNCSLSKDVKQQELKIETTGI